MVFRFQTHENVVLHAQWKGLTWEQACKNAASTNAEKGTVCSVRMNGKDEVEVVRRFQVKQNMWYRLGLNQKGLYQRVVLNRKDRSAHIDHFYGNWFLDEAFVGHRDSFLERGESISFVKQLFWVNIMDKFWNQFKFPFTASSYKRALKAQA